MNKTGYKYMYLLARYFNERLLYRLSVSQYKENFLLKGGTLLYAVYGLETRPTVDVDFMARHISRERNHLEKVFEEILRIECKEDGVVFNTESLRSEPITVEKRYPGRRFFFEAHMDSIVFPMSVDVGFGDVVTPSPDSIDFPPLLADIPLVNIQAYPIETLIAEKFHAMIVRDVANSRMKDFFDVYQILTTRQIDNKILFDAIKATFDNRELDFNPDLQLFNDDFYSDSSRLLRWKSFIRKIQWPNDLPFEDIGVLICTRLKSLYDKYWEQKL